MAVTAKRPKAVSASISRVKPCTPRERPASPTDEPGVRESSKWRPALASRFIPLWWRTNRTRDAHAETLLLWDPAAGRRAARDLRPAPDWRRRCARRLSAVHGGDRRSRGRAHERQDAPSDRRLHGGRR